MKRSGHGEKVIAFRPVEVRVLDVEARVRGSRVLYVARVRLRYPVVCSGRRIEREATISFEEREALRPIFFQWEVERRARWEHLLELPASELVGCRVEVPGDPPLLPWAARRIEARVMRASITALTSRGRLVVEAVAEARAGELAGTVEARLLCHPRRSVADCLRGCLAAHLKPVPKPDLVSVALARYGYRVVIESGAEETKEQKLPGKLDCVDLFMEEPYPLHRLRGLLGARRAARALAWLLERSTASIDVLGAREGILGTRLLVKLNPCILGADAPGCICETEPWELERAAERPWHEPLKPLTMHRRAARQRECRDNLLQFLEQWSPSHQTS